MPRVAQIIPESHVLLCEGCGYILSGLPSDSRCPECGKPIVESLPSQREIPDWERSDGDQPAAKRFWRTTAAVILHPCMFYRTLATRSDNIASRRFARIHVGITSVLLGLAGMMQLQWLMELPGLYNLLQGRSKCSPADMAVSAMISLSGFLACAVACYVTLAGVTRLASRLTAWEAAFRGYRLPYAVVGRGMDYHSPHYLPVAGGAFVTVAGYQVLLALGVLDGLSGPRYLYVLCVEVVLAAVYLFWTYWMAMRNMLFANR